MFLIRQGKPSDLDVLLKLAKMVHFINLPADHNVIYDKLRWSEQSFRTVRYNEAPADVENDPEYASLGGAAGSSPQFMFIVEDLETGNIIGTSGLVAQMGGPGKPNYALKLRQRTFVSTDLQGGTLHTTAQLIRDESGPTEIGGLIVGPSFRRHPLRLGKQLSTVRFHYIGLHRDRFSDRLIAEMMAPLTPDGRSTFWEYFGRRFINLTYDEADRFCQKSREFIWSLLPKEEIYLTLLPAEARALVGKVGRDTEPALKMLTELGFKYDDIVDPFDAGPHIEAKTDEIPLVRDTVRGVLGKPLAPGEVDLMAFVSVDLPDHGGDEFRCIWTEAMHHDGEVRVPEAVMDALGAGVGTEVGFTPTGPKRQERPRGAKKSRTRSATTKKRSGAKS